MKKLLFLSFLSLCLVSCKQDGILLETESFGHKGGWSVDQQFTFEMGSPYLLAHGLGKPVEDSFTEIEFRKKGTYHIYARTYNWTSPWSDKSGPGGFRIGVDDVVLEKTVGVSGESWMWEYVGQADIRSKGVHKISLHDLTGFDGRCDAIYITDDIADIPPAATEGLADFRARHDKRKIRTERFDLVVVGGGISGMCAAVSASRLGCKVALVNDRPLWGGCNSSETRVHLGGHIEMEPYPNLGNIIKEFGPLKGGNAQPAENYEDAKKKAFLESEENLSLFPSYRVYHVEEKDGIIRAVYASHIETGERVRFEAPVFSDCTGDGTVGYLAGADYAMGREGRDDYGEPSAPETPDAMTMGASVQWYSVRRDGPRSFPDFDYGLDFNERSCEKVTMGEWTWETGMNRNQCDEFERIRDYGLLVVYSNWSYLKNHLPENDSYDDRELEWVAYIAGKRESRRLLGDHVLTENDLINEIPYPDASFTTTWSIDLHYPDPENTAHFPGNEFKSVCVHGEVNPYAVPYRCLYSRNIDNLFMAGRDISVTHIALGTVRVMRTCGMMGEVVGMSASICREHGVLPRDVYKTHLDELKELMTEGAGEQGLPNNQLYNLGGHWPTYRKPQK